MIQRSSRGPAIPFMLILFFAAWPFPVAAQTVLNFEGLGNLQPIGTIAGATFSPNWLSISSCTAGGSGNFANPPSGVGIAFILVGGPGTTGTITFSQPVTAVSTRYIARTSTLTLTAFDAAGNVVGTAIGPQTSFPFTGQCGPSDTWGTVSISSPSAPIASVSLHDAGNFFAVDDFTFVTLAEKAAAFALSLKPANLRYGYGGKGYDFNPNVSLQRYVTPTVMANPGYWYRNCSVSISGGVATETCAATPRYKFAMGIDCSGLVMWSYNTAKGATTLFQDSNPIQYPSADSQFLYNSTPLAPGSALLPGDLLFFGTADRKTHVAMYIGGTDAANNVIESTLRIENGVTTDGVVTTSKTEATGRPSFQGSSRPIQFARVQAKARLFSPATLVLTDPDGLTINADTLSFTDEEVLREIPGQLYYVEETGFDDEVMIPTLKTGDYVIKVVPKSGAAATDTYSLTFETIVGNLTLAKDVPIAESPSQGYGIMSTGTAIIPFIPVAIDIKPGETQNSINPGSKGKIPVAILSSRTFDAVTQIDQTSLTFGRTGDESSLAFCNTEDVNGDGLLDLVCHFNTQSTGFVSGDTVGVLKGKTIDGISVRGTDSVNIVPH